MLIETNLLPGPDTWDLPHASKLDFMRKVLERMGVEEKLGTEFRKAFFPGAKSSSVQLRQYTK